MDCAHDTGRERGPAVRQRMTQVKHKLIVLSGKGGVGKSTVAVNLATALALEGKQVGLLDVDLHGPTVPQLMGLNGRPVLMEGDVLAPVPVGENLKVMSIAFLLQQHDDAVVWRGPMKAIAIEQLLGDVDWGELDYLVIDSPPGTGDEPLAVCQAIGQMDGAVIVTTPQETALANVRRSIKFCQLLDLKVLGVIENMSGFVCPHCGEVTDIFSKGGGESMAAKAGVPLLARVPLDPAIVQAGDSGKPYIYHYSKSPAAKEFTKAVEPVLALEDQPPQDRTSVETSSGKAKSEKTKSGEAKTSHAERQTVPPEPDAVQRFAVPTSDGLLCPHFGHCEEFTLVDVDPASKELLEVTTIPAPEHEPGLLPGWLADKGVGLIIAGGMGSKAQQLFAEQGVTVVTGATPAAPETVVKLYLTDALVTGENVCDH